ncbi:phage terminase small subunit P27 family [Altererythrobacter salegens]|uniref:Phage terminase small subunit P27 family n=1 Tax=Croceibacterium salegens TaxID=1737568 RepID=A0A6I4ST15_9SPHN|nr:phage terminase small subunit P27 family [Croceibacterium salegens]MXO58488.1 phage terminase small subunit P27 family [Croceibacterium salegens]
MARGRKPIPTHLKLVTGNPGKRKLPYQELRQRQRRLHPNRKLSSAQKKVWARVVKHAPFGLLQPIDAEVLTRYVVAACLYDEAAASIDASPVLVRAPSGYPMISPWLAVLNKQQAILQSLASELGFTPSSRARLGVRDDHEPINDIEAKFFDD